MGWFYVITQEMREMLEGKEVDVFAVINGFSQLGQGCFYGSLSELSKYCGIKSKTTTQNILKSLVERGFIIKEEEFRKGVKFCYYSVNMNCYGMSKIDMGISMDDMGGISKIDTNNKENINKNIKKDTIKEGKFNFKSALVQIGVSEEVADAWLQVRKTKRATNTGIAFKAVCEEIKKSGLSPNECITIAVQNSWQGFKAMWLEGRSFKSAPSQKKESVFEHNLKVMDQMYGTNLHAQTYGKKEVHHE